jgi:hypothetical protein
MRIQGVTLVFVVAMALARPAAAQPGTALIAGGLSFLHYPSDSSSETATGIAIDLAYNFPSSGQVEFGAVADIGFNSFNQCTEKSFGVGGRATFTAGAKAKPFGQFVIGHDGGCTGVTMLQPGFGLDVVISPKLNLRGQIDFRSLRYDSSYTEPRFWFGVSMNLGQ